MTFDDEPRDPRNPSGWAPGWLAFALPWALVAACFAFVIWSIIP